MAAWKRFVQWAAARMGYTFPERERLEQILALQAQRYGIADCRTLAAHVDLANHLYVAGAYTEAQKHYDLVLYWYRQKAGEHDPNVLILKFMQAQSFLREGDLISAKALLLHICDASRKAAGQNHPSTLLYFDSLAATLVRLGDNVGVRQIIVELLERRQESSQARDCSATLATASVLVTHMLNASQWRSALAIQEGILALLRRIRGEKDPETLLAASLFAVILIECGEPSPARFLLQTISEQFAETLGREHNQTLTVCFLLGAVMARQGDNVGARAVLERSYSTSKDNPSLDRTLAIRLGTELGSVLLRLEDYTAAQRLLSDLLPACETTDGEDSPVTLTNMNNLAVALWEQGRLEQGLRLQEELVRRRNRSYGSSHAETIESMATLAVMHSRVDRKRKITRTAEAEALEPAIEVLGRIVISGVGIVTRVRGFQIPTCKQ